MKRKLLINLFAFMLIFTLLPMTVYADVGPKPSIAIEFEGLEGEVYFVTLLSETDDTGPYSAVSTRHNNNDYQEGDEHYDIWKKFVAYESHDEYFFLQYFKDCSESHSFEWGYYPPSKFKILIYMPKNHSFIESEQIYERYAFDSYFNAEVEGDRVVAEKDYQYTSELLSFLVRVLLTLGIEILIALLFGLRQKRILKYIIMVNIITQMGLNILLNIGDYLYGAMLFVMAYVLLEIMVIVVEAMLYTRWFNQTNRHLNIRPWIAPVYAIVANVISFVVGMAIAIKLPGIF